METKKTLPAYTADQLQGMALSYAMSPRFADVHAEDKEEMVQTFILAGLEAAAKENKDKDGIRSYQYRTALGTVRNWIRERMQATHKENVSMALPVDRDGEDGTLADTFAAPESVLTPDEKEMVAAAVACLETDQREAVVRTVYNDQTLAEAAAEMGTSAARVFQLRAAALETLRFKLQDLASYAA
jgi:RNA polymerase sigma factor (sigma-70 family)